MYPDQNSSVDWSSVDLNWVIILVLNEDPLSFCVSRSSEKRNPIENTDDISGNGVPGRSGTSI